MTKMAALNEKHTIHHEEQIENLPSTIIEVEQGNGAVLFDIKQAGSLQGGESSLKLAQDGHVSQPMPTR